MIRGMAQIVSLEFPQTFNARTQRRKAFDSLRLCVETPDSFAVRSLIPENPNPL